MKKLLAISLIAMTAVTAANAEIASKAYVDQQDDAVEAIVTALSGKVGNIPEGASATTVVGYIDEAVTSAGGQTAQQVSSAIDTKVGTLDGNITGSGNVVATISEADGIVTGTMGNALDKIGTASGDGNVITAISKNSDNQTIDVVKGITALTASDIDQTYDATSAKAQSGVAVASAISAAGGQTAQQVSSAIDTKVGTLDGNITGSGNVVATISEADGIVTGTMGNALDKIGTASGDGNVITAISKNSDNQTIDVVKGITALTASDIDQTYDATSAKAQSGVAVASAISAAGGQTAQQVSDAIDTKVGTLDDTSGAAQAGKWVTAVTQTDGKITATMADPLAAFTKLSANQGDGVYALTATASDGNITGYKWELIERATPAQP